MMYEMLSGHLPFDADDVVEVAIKQITDKPKSLQELAPTVPHGLVEITERAMAKRPENRYASAAEMLGALNATWKTRPSCSITPISPMKFLKRWWSTP